MICPGSSAVKDNREPGRQATSLRSDTTGAQKSIPDSLAVSISVVEGFKHDWG